MKHYQKTRKQIAFFLLTILVGIVACTKESTSASPSLATITTNAVSTITGTSAIVGGNVTSQGASAVTAYGIAINTAPNPTVAAIGIQFGTGTGTFSDTLTGLDPNTTYYIRAYATNTAGTAYGSETSFTTAAGCNLVNVTANITTPTTWTADKVYVLRNDIEVLSNLTIEPGTVVKFATGGRVRLTISSPGKVIAEGTAANRISFTSLADDTKCGDTNGDGNGTTPAKGDWSEIRFSGSPIGTIFRYCDFTYGGSDYWQRGVLNMQSIGTTATIDNCVFAHNCPTTTTTSCAIYGTGISSATVITNNTFYDNDRPILIAIYYSLDASNTFHNPANAAEINKHNGIFIITCTWLLSTTMNITETEVPTVFATCSAVTVTGGGTLNIGANVVIKVLPGIDFYYTNTNKINFGSNCLFTSYKDDAHGGDTNGDGDATTPADGDWKGIYNNSTLSWQTANAIYDSH